MTRPPINVRVGTNPGGRVELSLSDSASWDLFLRLAETICRHTGGKPAKQHPRLLEFLWLLDQFYLDIHLGDLTVTLEREHYLGITLVSTSPAADPYARHIAEVLARIPLAEEPLRIVWRALRGKDPRN